MIELTHVSKDFGKGQQEVHAVRDVSLSIDKGEIFGIIGFSGAGKSTFVSVLCGILKNQKGCVYMDETAAAYFSRILNEFSIRSAKFCSFVVHRVH